MLILQLIHVLKEYGFGEVQGKSKVLMRKLFLLIQRERLLLIEVLNHTTQKFLLWLF